MKYIYCITALIISSNLLHAQTSYPKPEFSNLPYYFNKNTQQLVMLEKTTATVKNKTKLLGYGGSSSQYVIDGEKSNVSIQGADSIEFVMAGSGTMSMMDPSQMV